MFNQVKHGTCKPTVPVPTSRIWAIALCCVNCTCAHMCSQLVSMQSMQMLQATNMTADGCCHLQVLLRFNARFHSSIFVPGQLFDVRFAIKRTGFVFMHEALDVAERGLAAAAAAGARPELLLPPADARPVPGKPLQVRLGFSANWQTRQQSVVIQKVSTGLSSLWFPIFSCTWTPHHINIIFQYLHFCLV